MKILQISSVPITYKGGTEKVVLELSRLLSKENEVTVLQTDLYMPGQVEKETSIGDVRVITCKNDHFLGGYGYSSQFKEVLKKIWKDYDVIHIEGYGRFTSDFSLKYLYKKKPMVFTAHGFFHSKKDNFFKQVHNLTRGRLLKKADFCTALTELEVEEYLKRGVKKEKILVVPDGADLKLFKKNAERGDYFKNKNKTLLYVGRIHQSKGLSYVLEAIKNLSINLLIVGGDAGYRTELEKRVEELKIGDRVKFTGQVDDATLLKAYASSDFLVLFSEWEGFGLTVIEAMASGKPVVVSNRGSLPYLVKDGQTGLIAEYPNVDSLRAKLETILASPKLVKGIISNAKEFSDNFDWGRVSEEYLKIYHRAVYK